MTTSPVTNFPLALSDSVLGKGCPKGGKGASLLARRYTLPAKCAITRDDLIQEAYLAILEHSASDSSACLALLEHSASDSAADGNLSLALSDSVLGKGCPKGGKGASMYAIARKAMQRAISRYVSPVTRSLDAPIYPSSGEGGGEADITLAYTIPDIGSPNPEQRLIAAESQQVVQQVLATCNPRWQFVYRRLVCEQATVAEVAAQLGITPIHVRVIKHKLLSRIHQRLKK